MEYSDFNKLIKALTAKPKETEWLEFKHIFHSAEEIGERISALSNSASLCNMPFGYIVFGVDDASHNVCGTDLYGKRKGQKRKGERLLPTRVPEICLE